MILLIVHFAFFGFQIISYDSPRGGVSVITEKGDVTASFLVVQHAKPSDSGTYSCSPSLGDTVSVNVHVLRGKQTAENVYKLWHRSSIWLCDLCSNVQCSQSNLTKVTQNNSKSKPGGKPLAAFELGGKLLELWWCPLAVIDPGNSEHIRWSKVF